MITEFSLQRDDDESGVSGTGRVAEGVEFQDGTCILKWLVSGETWGTYVDGFWEDTGEWLTGIEKVERIHGHEGRTKVLFDGVNPMKEIARHKLLIDRLKKIQKAVTERLNDELTVNE